MTRSPLSRPRSVRPARRAGGAAYLPTLGLTGGLALAGSLVVWPAAAQEPPGAPEGEPPVPVPLPTQKPPPEVARWLEAPVQEAVPELAGRRRVRFSEPSPLSLLEVYLERSATSAAQAAGLDPSAATYDPSAESYQLFVPAGEPRAAGWGLLVWISPTGYGGFSRPGIEEVLERRRMIWVGADGAGNPRALWDRWGLALDAAHHLPRLYPIDTQRVYAAGYSGGGRVASALATLYPESFAGAFCWFGVDHFHELPLPGRPGARWPARFPRPPRSRLRKVRAEGRFVLLTGEHDFNRPQTRAAYEHLRRDGFRHLTLIDVPGANHYYGVRPEWLERGLEVLDGGAE